MKVYIFLAFISLIICEIPTFEITEVFHQDTRCDDKNGYFIFVINGKGTCIKDEIRITLPLKSPESCKAVCMVNSEKMTCIIDALIYDLEGEKLLEVFEEEPQFDNLKISNWKEYFIPERRILNHATNCKNERESEQIFAVYEAKKLEILGCFRNKNNFSFQLTKVKDENNYMQDSLEQEIYFEISFEKPSNNKAFCVMPKNSIDEVYTIKCSIEYGGEIEIGKKASGEVDLDGKKFKVILRGLLIPPTIVDECNNDGN